MRKFPLKKIGDIFRGSPKKEELKSEVWTLDRTPTFAEERRDFTDEGRSTGAVYDKQKAMLRVDALARYLAICWSFFLAYVILAQGSETGAQIAPLFWSDRGINIIPFDLESGEFIAVVTTTTASVFGFLVIVANALFKAEKQ